MTNDGKTLSKLDWHKKMTVELFNQTWDLIDKKERTIEEDDEMIHTTHASRFH